MKTKAEKRIKTGSCRIKFPERVWEPSYSGEGWVSRAATDSDMADRKKAAELIGAVIE
jgi:hypothetical protein